MMVDDDDVALHRAPPHFGNEAALPLTAFLSRTGVRARIELMPKQARLWQFSELGAVSGCGVFFPRCDRAVMLDLFQPAEDRLIGQVVEFFPAEIVVPALHVADGKPRARRGLAVQRLLQERDVLVKELLLKIFRPRRDDYSFS